MKRQRKSEAPAGSPRNERVARPERAPEVESQRKPRRGARVKATAQRAFGITWRVALAAAVVVGALELGDALERFVRTSESFALEHVEIRGAKILSEEAILAASGLVLGENVFKSPPEEVERRLAAHPWVSDVRVRRKLPGRFEIEVREHAARAILAIDSLYLVSREGVVFKEIEPGEHHDLPVVTFEDRGAIRSSRQLRAELLRDVAALLHEVEAAEPAWAATLAEIHVHRDGSFILRFGEAGTEVRLGKGGLDGKLRRLRQVFERLDRAGLEAATVYADNERRPDRLTVELR